MPLSGVLGDGVLGSFVLGARGGPGEITRTVTNTLTLSQSVSLNVRFRFPSNALVLSNSASATLRRLRRHTASHLALSNSCSAVLRHLRRHAVNHLTLTSTVERPHGARNSLNFTEIIPDFYNPIFIVHELANRASVELSHLAVRRGLRSTLTLGQAAHRNRVAPRTARNTLSLNSVASPFIPGSRCFLQQWSGVEAPVLIRRSTVVLSFPFNSPTATLELRPPGLDNIDRLAFERINRETRGGTLDIFADPEWPKYKRLVLEFTPLSESEGQALQAFKLQTLGQPFRFLDWESREWKALIVNPSEPVVRNRNDVLAAQLELEVEPVL